MTSSRFIPETRGLERTRWLLSLVCAASVAGCAQGVGTLPVGTAASTHAASGHHARYADAPIVYAFGGTPDGATPYAALTDVGGTLYGMTADGGTANQGIVFSVTPGGTETILHSFAGIPDGAAPLGALINVAGTLYGTTSYGGAHGNGTIFSITTSGAEKVLYSFGSTNDDGITPAAAPLYSGGALYGTTGGGGSTGCGTVFRVALTGKKAKETVIYNFAGGSDGCGPQSALIQYKNAFYGTTISGGNPSGGGVGTIFKVTPAGSETVLHIFTGQPDGADSHAALIAYNANFYGMTEEGGSKGLGTVFKMTPKGKLTIIHNFTNSQGEGYHPFGATLLNVNGTFYGSLSSTYVGSGGIFQITPSGSESLAYVFGDNIAGVYSDVIDVGGLLYGTTINGGPAEQGTVYAVPL